MMGRCQHCGQGAIAKDINGPVCPDCWDEGRYETANPMTNETEAPERIWAKPGMPGYINDGPVPGVYDVEYTRAALSDAKDKRIEELEAERDEQVQWVKDLADDVISLEAKLAKAMDGLRECEGEIDQYIRQEYPHDHPVQERYRQRDFAANPARTTIAELKGTDQ